MTRKTLYAVAAAGALALALAGPALPAQANQNTTGVSPTCFDPAAAGALARGGHNLRAGDHREITVAEQSRIEQRTARILTNLRNALLGGKGKPGGGTGPGGPLNDIPVYVHQMLSSSGAGAVTDTQIAQQIDELNQDYAGRDASGHSGAPNGDQPASANTGAHFYLAGSNKYYNDTWHKDRQSTQYRAATRQGGKNALNIWLVDFKYLGIATFPWDYASNPQIDGIRVQWDSLPGGDITHYNLGKTATHEAGHWLGLYHTFQGGCNQPNDEVADTPAQSSPTTGCPEGRDSCALPGLDPIHNYMDYSYDECYDEFTPNQATRIQSMWTAYRA
jgi:hypothetical protein